MPLTDIALKAAKPAEKIQRLFDGGGLYLEISTAGGKWWRFKYRFDGKEKRLSLGVYPDVSLKDARERRQEMRRGSIRSALSASSEQRWPALNCHQLSARLAQASMLSSIASAAE